MADNPKSQISFDHSGIGTILSHFRLHVPPNQREYAWKDREVTQLFQDFSGAIETDHFLGTIVTISRGDENHLEVVDGQQRLATTALLLAAIRDYLKDKDKMLVDSINNQFLNSIDRVKKAHVPHLTLNVDDNALFSWIIAQPETAEPPITRDSHRRLKRAYVLAKDHVKKIVAQYDPKQHVDRLNNWISFIEFKAQVVLLRVATDANAYRMFETLNDRGLRTSQADLIKNFILGRSGSDRLKETEAHWISMRGVLESLSEEDITVTFLRHALIIIRGFVREAQVYEAVQQIATASQYAVDFSVTLENLALTYAATYGADHEKWNSYPETVRKSLEVFDLTNIRPMQPLILAIAHKMKPLETGKCFEFLVSLSIRLIIAANTRSGSVELPLAETAHEIYNERIKTCKELRIALNGLVPKDKEFEAEFIKARSSNAKLGRYYLRSLEKVAKGEPDPWFMPNDDKSTINLEHILPKKPEGNWPQFTEEQVDLYVNRIGNLALLRARDNSGFGSAGFSKKKPTYAGASYETTKQAAQAADWTPTTIEERQATLATLALKAWPV